MNNPNFAFLKYPTEEVNTPYYSLKVYSVKSFAYVIWFGDITDEVYRTSMFQVIEMAGKHNIQNLLSDGSEIGNITPETKQWMMEVLLPQLLKSKIKKIARIAYNDYLGFLTNQSLLRAVPDFCGEEAVFELQTFTEIDPAIEWLNF
jgi:hypothetical protein